MSDDMKKDAFSRRGFLEMGTAALAAAGMLSADAAAQNQKPYPTKDDRSASAPGPGNPAIDAQNPDSFLPPPTDAGGVQTFKYPFGLSHKRMQEGGWSREVTIRELAVSKSIAGVDMRLTAGGIRELHWHTAAEWSIMLYGNARITGLDADGKSFVSDVTEGDLWYFPTGIPHSIQGLGPDGCEFLLVFDDGNFSEYETVLLTDWMAHTPHEVLSKNFGVSEQALENMPKREKFIFQAPVPGPLPADLKATAGSLGLIAHRFLLSHIAATGNEAHQGRRGEDRRFQQVQNLHHDCRSHRHRPSRRDTRTALASQCRRMAVLHQRLRKNDRVRHRRPRPHHGFSSRRRGLYSEDAAPLR